MEYQIEIIGKETLEMHRQLYRKVLSILNVMIVLLYGGAILKEWLLNNHDLSFRIVFTIYLVLAGSLFSCIPNWIAKRSYRNKLKYYNGEMPTVVSRFDDKILIQDVDSWRTIPYEKLTKINFLPDCILLRLGQHQTIGIPNREFSKGSMKELKQLLREKRPDLKIPE